MSDEEDYMSLKFLEEAEDFQKKKEESYSERRKRQLREQKEKGYIAPLHIREQEEREKGLQTSVNNNNKGMQMLMKMGFKKGTALGKCGFEGIVEPIQVDLKSDRQGLGMGNLIKKRMREEEEELERKKVHMNVDDFRVAMAQKKKESVYMKYLFAAVSICQKLDEECDIQSNILWLLKPQEEENELEDKALKDDEAKKREEQKEEEELKKRKQEEERYTKEEINELEGLQLEEKVERLIEYLREKHLYCFWCRVKYTDIQDLQENCPGTEQEDH